MNRLWLPVVFAVVFFSSCTGNPGKRIPNFPDAGTITVQSTPFIITDHKNKASGGNIPEWVSLYLDGGVREIEALEAYDGLFVFVGRNEGNNFTALNHWVNGFYLDLDFPRLAAARIETRFNVPFPDQEYGAFFESLIRASSDTPWKGAVREDDFWIYRKFIPDEDEVIEAAIDQMQDEADEEQIDFSRVDENWEFFVLVTIEKNLFASQLEAVFQNLKPNPRPTRDQTTAANRVKDRFFEGF